MITVIGWPSAARRQRSDCHCLLGLRRFLNDAHGAGAGPARDEQKYREVFEKIRTAFNQEYVKPDGTIGTGSQTSYVLAYT